MSDILTAQIIKELYQLPIGKKRAILELIRTDSSKTKIFENDFKEKWKQSLLTTSVWTDSDIDEIYKAREYFSSCNNIEHCKHYISILPFN